MTECYRSKMLSSLANSLGNVAIACKEAGISRQTHYRWLKEDEDYAEAVLEQSEVVLDIAEAKLIERVQEGDLRAIMFLLKTKGKERGYDEKRTVSIKQQSSGAPQIHFGDTTHKYEIVTKEMTQEELDDIGYVSS